MIQHHKEEDPKINFINGGFDNAFDGWTTAANGSTITLNVGTAYFGGGSANTGAHIEQILNTSAGQQYWVDFGIGFAGSLCTPQVSCIVTDINTATVLLNTTYSTTGNKSTAVFTPTGAILVRFLDSSIGPCANRDVFIDNCILRNDLYQ